jgi:hypothetical protein
MLAKVKALAKHGRDDVCGRPAEHWLNLLNHEASQTIYAYDTFVLAYEGQEFLFVDGGLAYALQNGHGWTCSRERACILIAVGRPAVALLSENARLFRIVTGSTELVAFTIFRSSAFAAALNPEA